MGGLGPVSPAYKSNIDIPNGGVLVAVPALLASGLFYNSNKHFILPNGYYGLHSIFLLLAFMALSRIKFIEDLRFTAPGEWGKLLGLDRIPEVRTLREKIKILTKEGKGASWSADLCKYWMDQSPKDSSILYIDGHVRVYHGHQTKLPRHYVARDKLYARATCDYWINGMNSQPFLIVNKEVDPGLIQVIKTDFLPILEKEVPNQPSQNDLEENPLLHKFTIIFDREGYSPQFFLDMKKKRIACQTYHKYPGEDWLLEEFVDKKIKSLNGKESEIKIAERGICFITKDTNEKIWMREVRLIKNEKQASILSTDYINNLEMIAVNMISRWSQENFFAYMTKHYNIDRLVSYMVEEIDDTIKVTNPKYRNINSKIRKNVSLLSRLRVKFNSINLNEQIGSEKFKENEEKKAELFDEINGLQELIEIDKKERKTIKRYICFGELPEEEKFMRLSVHMKHFMDTVKMIAYRAETITTSILKEGLKGQNVEETRSLLRSIFHSSVDLEVDCKQGIMYVKLHHLANQRSDDAIRNLFIELNELKTQMPGTNLTLFYKLVSD